MKSGKIDTPVKKYDFLTQSEVWEAGMLIYQGINFLFFTESSFSGTAYGIAIPVGLLALCRYLFHLPGSDGEFQHSEYNGLQYA